VWLSNGEEVKKMRNKGIAMAVAGGATAAGGMGATAARAIFSGAKRKELVEFLSEALDKDPEAIQEAFENMGTNHQTHSKVAVGQKLEKSLDSDKIKKADFGKTPRNETAATVRLGS